MANKYYCTTNIYTKITKAMEQLKNKDVSSVEVNEEYGDIIQIKKVKYDNNKTFELNAYYDNTTCSLYEFKIYYILKGIYEDCCTLPSYFGKEQEKDLREFLNMYVD